MQTQNPEQRKKQLPSEVYYNMAELPKPKYVKVVYTGLDGNSHEITTDVKFLGDVLISLYFRCERDFNINYPQDILIKFITSDAMYVAKAVLQEIKKADDYVYFSIIPPAKVLRRQNRKYVRVDLDRTCVLVITDKDFNSTTYLTKSINLSACGVLLHNLETMDSNDVLSKEVKMSKYDCYHIVIFLEPDLVLKLFARYVRHEKVNTSHRYAFQFLGMKEKETDMICKYVTNEQLKQLKGPFKSK